MLPVRTGDVSGQIAESWKLRDSAVIEIGRDMRKSGRDWVKLGQFTLRF